MRLDGASLALPGFFFGRNAFHHLVLSVVIFEWRWLKQEQMKLSSQNQFWRRLLTVLKLQIVKLVVKNLTNSFLTTLLKICADQTASWVTNPKNTCCNHGYILCKTGLLSAKDTSKHRRWFKSEWGANHNRSLLPELQQVVVSCQKPRGL